MRRLIAAVVGGKHMTMHDHGSCVLTGPVTRERGWWSKKSRPVSRPKSPIRTELVERVRAQIAAGTYDTPERFEAALAKMLMSIEA